MKYNGHRIGTLLSIAVACILLCSCGTTGQGKKDIVILYTNDVHCAVEDHIGYAGLAAYREYMEGKTPYVSLVDCGDAIQGDVIGLLSEGEYPVQIMNRVGYDLAVPGNHEFDYGMEQLSQLIQEAEAEYLGCNLRYTGAGENALKDISPYHMENYGDVDVAFIGVCTPENITSSTPTYFMDEAGKFVYDFYVRENGEEMYEQVQATVDECLAKGAEYVILLTHLGVDEDSAPFRSIDLIAHTEGVDAVLDGHSHSVIPCQVVKNKIGSEVLLSSTGAELNYIGQLTITPDGTITTGLITYPDKDEETETYVRGIVSSFQEDMKQVVGHSETDLSIASGDGIRMVRNRETNLGDFCADAFRLVSGADIAIINGGGIRANLPAGDITYGDLLAVHPYGNTLCVVEASGQEILDALEMANRAVQTEFSDGINAVGENGGFLQVSGLAFTVDTSVASSVVLDENEMFISCGDVRRVRDVRVLQEDGSYVPIDPDGIYTLASQNYLLKQGGDGQWMFMDNPPIMEEGMADYQVLIAYIDGYLGGTIGEEYAVPQERIVVK